MWIGTTLYFGLNAFVYKGCPFYGQLTMRLCTQGSHGKLFDSRQTAFCPDTAVKQYQPHPCGYGFFLTLWGLRPHAGHIPFFFKETDMFCKSLLTAAIVRYCPMLIGLSMGLSLFFGMSFALWGPESDRTASLSMMVLSAVLLLAFAACDTNEA